MNIITILPNGAVIEGSVPDAEVADHQHAGTFTVYPSERLDTWFENVAFFGNINDEHSMVRNESATRLHIPADDRSRAAFYGPAFLIGLDGRTPTDLPASVTVAEVERLIALYNDH